MLKLHTKISGQERARVVVYNEHDEVLLVRGLIGPNWSLPGGGIEKGELPVDAVARELLEETGLKLAVVDLELVAVLRKPLIPVNYVAHIFVGSTKKTHLPKIPHNPREIIELAWFDPKHLPHDTSPLVHAALESLSKNRVI
jgi:8-oxo-dGTP pyrophosphatase MutT (NUDIX family)